MITPGQEPRSLRQVLSELMGVSVETYRHFACKWFRDNMNEHHVALDWWMKRHQSTMLYQAILGTAEGDTDGLEVLAISASMQMHLNILQMDQVWTSHHNDYSKHDVMIVLSGGGALLCEWPEVVPPKWEMSAIDSSLETSAEQPLQQDMLSSVKKLVHTLGG